MCSIEEEEIHWNFLSLWKVWLKKKKKKVVFSNHWSQKAWFWLFLLASTTGLGGINYKWSLSMPINLKTEFGNSFYYAIIHSIEYENTFIIFYSIYREI